MSQTIQKLLVFCPICTFAQMILPYPAGCTNKTDLKFCHVLSFINRLSHKQLELPQETFQCAQIQPLLAFHQTWELELPQLGQVLLRDPPACCLGCVLHFLSYPRLK